MLASLVLPKFRVTGIAGVEDRGVGRGNRCLVTGLDRWNELRGSRLHRRDQLVDMIIGGEDLRFDLALGDIGTRRNKVLSRVLAMEATVSAAVTVSGPYAAVPFTTRPIPR
jgi:hypothetical protein